MVCVETRDFSKGLRDLCGALRRFESLGKSLFIVNATPVLSHIVLWGKSVNEGLGVIWDSLWTAIKLIKGHFI